MKKFRIYQKISEYLVFKCPNCKSVFRRVPQDTIFGRDRKNVKCIHCEKLFDFKENQMDEDPIDRMWGEIDGKEMIMVKPNGDKEFFFREKNKCPDFNEAIKSKEVWK